MMFYYFKNKITSIAFRCSLSAFLIVCLTINCVGTALADTSLFNLSTISEASYDNSYEETEELIEISSLSDIDEEENSIDEAIISNDEEQVEDELEVDEYEEEADNIASISNIDEDNDFEEDNNDCNENEQENEKDDDTIASLSSIEEEDVSKEANNDFIEENQETEQEIYDIASSSDVIDNENLASKSDISKCHDDFDEAIIIASKSIATVSIAKQDENETYNSLASFNSNIIKDKLGALNNDINKSTDNSSYSQNIDIEKGYANNEVIIIKNNNYKNNSKLFSSNSDNNDNSLNEFRNLLNDAENILNIGNTNEITKNNKLFASSNEEKNNKSILFLHNDSYSTDELIENLSKLPEVESVEPNIVFNASDFYVKDEFVTYDELMKNEKKLNSINNVSNDTYEINETSNKKLQGSILLSTTSVTPTDYTDKQWALKEGTGDYQYSIKVASWNDATYKNTEGIVVAVIDDGIDLDHPDLKNVIWSEGDTYPTSLGGGKYGFNAVANSNFNDDNFVSTDPSGRNFFHGNHVAGIIAAEWNDIGVSGICNGAKILPVKIFNKHGNSTLYSCILAYKYLIELRKLGVNIVCANNSWGTLYDSTVLKVAVEEAGKYNIASLFASGNTSQDIDVNLWSNSALKFVDCAMIVNASDKYGVLADYSNYGEMITDFVAPGSKIISCMNSKFKVFNPPATGIYPTYRSKYFTGQESEDFFPIDDTIFADDVSFLDYKYNTKFDYKRGYLIVQSSTTSNAKIKFVSRGFDSNFSSDKLYLQYSISALSGTKLEYDIMIPVIECDESGVVTGTEVFDYKVASASCYVLSEDFQYPYVDLNAIYSYTDSDTTHYCKAYLGDKTDKFYFWVLVRGYDNDKNTSLPSYQFYIGDPSIFENDPIPYDYKNGTSLACPTACGALAVIAKNYSTATPSEWLAYLKGSVSSGASTLPTGSTGKLITTDICMSNGIVNLKNALAGVVSPVITSYNLLDDSTSNYKYEINGFFFGDEKGNISIGGYSLTSSITSWTDKKIVFETSENLSGANIEVRVIRADSKWGRNFYNINEKENTYEDVKLYDGLSDDDIKTFKSSKITNAIECENKIYFRTITTNNEFILFFYDISTKKWSKKDLNMLSFSYTQDYYAFISNFVEKNDTIYALCNKTNVASGTFSTDYYLFKYDITSNTNSLNNISFGNPENSCMSALSLYVDNDSDKTMYIFGALAYNSVTGTQFPSNSIYKIDESNSTYVISPTSYTLPKATLGANSTKIGVDGSGNKCLYLAGGFSFTTEGILPDYSIIKLIFNSDGSISSSIYNSECSSLKSLISDFDNSTFLSVKNGFYIVSTLSSECKNVYQFDVPNTTVTAIGNVTLGEIQKSAGAVIDENAYVLADSVFTEGIRVFKTFDAPDFDPESSTKKSTSESSNGSGYDSGYGSIGLEFLGADDLPSTNPNEIVAFDINTTFEFDPILNQFRFAKTDVNGNKSYIVNKWVCKTTEKGNKEIYLTDEMGYMVTGFVMKNNKLYYMSTDTIKYGQMMTGTININGDNIYFDKTGAFADDKQKMPLIYKTIN